MTHAKNIFTYMLALFSTLAIVGCSFEEDHADCQGNGEGEKMQVELRLTASANSLTRSYSTSDGVTRASWVDTNAAREGEMMHNCFVVIVQNGKIQSIVQRDFTEEVEQTSLKAKAELGNATFYSFANITPAELGITMTTTPTEIESKYYKVEGNTAQLSAKGIPMSNKQTVNITSKKQQVDLEVIRMMAKVELNFTNDTGYDLSIKSVKLTDITDNAADNVSLLPMKDASGNVVPNINAAATYKDYTVSIGGTSGTQVKNGGTLQTTFYVNESVARNPKYFVLSINTDKGTVTNRIAMTEWSKIARNDYLVIPVKLVDYRIELEPQVFTAIGVIPELNYDGDRITATFKSYGEFHLKLHVIKRSDNTELNNWTFKGITTLEADPAGGEGTSIYDEAPYFDNRTKTFEGYISPRKGYAIHEINVEINGVTIPYRLQINKE
ncbi:DUF4906 domain-containing protein [Prevotella sp. 885]|uniref:DUF4906 domain-containing protein n=1 Tax=Prevotella sp. 885 TaxID=2022527 RepID=UPI000B9FA038|nr:DUF4906 domain-containing protein [Prevotella sp. 885]OZT03787.1 hypothetical protein CHL74_08475 [Prevotella sp. 885]